MAFHDLQRAVTVLDQVVFRHVVPLRVENDSVLRLELAGVNADILRLKRNADGGQRMAVLLDQVIGHGVAVFAMLAAIIVDAVVIGGDNDLVRLGDGAALHDLQRARLSLNAVVLDTRTFGKRILNSVFGTADVGNGTGGAELCKAIILDKAVARLVDTGQ